MGQNLKNKIYGPLTTILGCVHLIQPKNILLQSVEENVNLFLTVNSDNLSLKMILRSVIWIKSSFFDGLI